MTVWDILNQFTNLDFTLIIYDVISKEELYYGGAAKVFYDDIGRLIVVAIQPPRRAYEVILNVAADQEVLELDDNYNIVEELEWQNQIRA